MIVSRCIIGARWIKTASPDQCHVGAKFPRCLDTPANNFNHLLAHRVIWIKEAMVIGDSHLYKSHSMICVEKFYVLIIGCG